MKKKKNWQVCHVSGIQLQSFLQNKSPAEKMMRFHLVAKSQSFGIFENE